jgi:hypothetical protein
MKTTFKIIVIFFKACCAFLKNVFSNTKRLSGFDTTAKNDAMNIMAALVVQYLKKYQVKGSVSTEEELSFTFAYFLARIRIFFEVGV